MRASSQAAAHHAPQPLPLPLPLPPPPLSLPSPPAAPRRGRHRASTSSSSSSSSVSAASSSSFYSYHSPSPAASPPRGSTPSLVPFSWERHAGVPKMNSFRGGGSPTSGAPLPLPPPLRLAPRRRRANANVAAASSSGSGDPFAAAFAECTREDGEDDEADHGADVVVAENKLSLARAKPTASGRAERRWWLAGGVGFLDLYGCKSAMAVADGAFLARRPVVAHGRRASRR